MDRFAHDIGGWEEYPLKGQVSNWTEYYHRALAELYVYYDGDVTKTPWEINHQAQSYADADYRELAEELAADEEYQGQLQFDEDWRLFRQDMAARKVFEDRQRQEREAALLEEMPQLSELQRRYQERQGSKWDDGTTV